MKLIGARLILHSLQTLFNYQILAKDLILAKEIRDDCLPTDSNRRFLVVTVFDGQRWRAERAIHPFAGWIEMMPPWCG
jgi:hypothetical protein